MKMTDSDLKKYPKLTFYVKNNLPDIVHAPVIVQAMNKIGQINRARLIAALKWGAGPRIKIVPGLAACGKFFPAAGSNELQIDQRLVKDFENGKGTRRARAGNVYVVGVTLLHELIHWGDNLDGIDRLNEEGEEFERLVYGSVIPC